MRLGIGDGTSRTKTYTISIRIDNTNCLAIAVASRARLHREKRNVGIVEDAGTPTAKIIRHGIRETCPEKCRSSDLPPVNQGAWAMTVTDDFGSGSAGI